MRRFPALILVTLMCVAITSQIAVFAEDTRWRFRLDKTGGDLVDGLEFTVGIYFIPMNGDMGSPADGNDGATSLEGFFIDLVFDNSVLDFGYNGTRVTYYWHYVPDASDRIWYGVPNPTIQEGDRVVKINGFGHPDVNINPDVKFYPDDQLDPLGLPTPTEYYHLATLHFTGRPGIESRLYENVIKEWAEPTSSQYLGQIDGDQYKHDRDVDDDAINQWKDSDGGLNLSYLNYVRHLELIDENGDDLFPEESVSGGISYYTAVASARMALRFISGPPILGASEGDPRDWPEQDELFGLIGGTDGEDLTAQQLATLLNMLTYNHPDPDWPWRVYHFGAQADFSTGDPQQGDPKQDLAIKRLIHWIEFDVPNVPDLLDDDHDPQVNAPAHVPFGGTYSWLTVRGFSSEYPPMVEGSVHALPQELKFYGAWVNDPRVGPGVMGYDEFLTAEKFKENYLQVEGAYRSVAEPPPSPVEDQLESSLDSIQLTYVSGKRSAAVSAALGRQEEMDVALQNQGDIVLVLGSKSLEHAQMLQSQFEEIQWEELIPVELLTASDFTASYSDTRFNQALTVYNIDRDEQYNLLLFGKSDSLDSVSVVLQVDESNARFQRASWIDEEYQYLSSRGARRIAYDAMQDSYSVDRVELTRWYKRGVVSDAQGVEQPVEYTTRLVWSAELSPSEFLPVHEVSTPFGPTVLVKQDGTYTVQGDLDPQFLQQEPTLSSAVEEPPADTTLSSFQETALATLPLSSLVAFEAQSEEGIALNRPAEVWIRINEDFSGDKDTVMAQTASLFREVTGSSDRVVVTLWEGSVRIESLEL